MKILALLFVLSSAVPAAARAVGSAEKARPVTGDTGLSSMLIMDQPQFRVLRDYAEPGAAITEALAALGSSPSRP